MPGAGRWLSGARSLRARLTVASTLIVAAGLVAASLLLLDRQAGALQAALDVRVSDRAAQIADSITADDPANVVAPRLVGEVAVQVMSPTGMVLAASPELRGQPPLFTFPVGPRVAIHTVRHLPLGEQGSYVVAGISALGGERVYAALPDVEVEQSVHELAAALVVGVPLLTLGFGVVGYVLVGRALRPVERMRRQAATITVTDLHNRLEVPAGRDALHALGETLNEVLARLERATTTQRQFLADAAHELRSPLAGLMANVEIAASGRIGAPTTPVEFAADLLPEVTRLSRLVDDLLQLARLDANPRPRAAAVDLDDCVFAEVRRVRAGLATGAVRRGQPGLRVDESGVGAVRVVGDADALTRVVGNLLDNAVRHAHLLVTVRLREQDGRARLEVIDDGPGIPVTERERVFERFTRLDDARSRDAGGSGLGLAIVRDVVVAHAGTVTLQSAPGGGALAVVQLPVHPAASRRSAAGEEESDG